MTIGAGGLVVPALLGGRYRSLGSVGRGAIAEVVRARDERTGAEVALKILYPHLRENAAVAERFKREVEIVRRISHPHVLAIHDVVESEGQLFLVMDYRPGGDLADLIARRGRLPPDELARLAAQLCGALAAAHRAGVVHRDVKPSNVLCGPGPTLDVRLCDFGLARASELSGLTTANAVLGTPEYMAPEVITEGDADPRSDIYSLGVVLFEAATGRTPFHGDSPYQLMRQHVDVEAPRARSLASDLPAAFDDAIARALAKDPLDRFATAADLARALEAAPDALAHAASVGLTRRSCPRCGGWLVDAAASCADCGARMLKLDPQRGGSAVVVSGPGQVADKVDAWRHVALFKILDELPGAAGPKRRDAPRVPFFVVKNVTPESADALVTRLQALGLECRAVPRSPLVVSGTGKRIWRLTWRYVAGIYGVVQMMSFSDRYLPRIWALAFVPLAGFVGVAFSVATARALRPLISAVPAPGRLGDAPARLAGALTVLESRQDRRLLARLLERLAQAETLGHGDVALPLGGRAAQAAEALGALEARRRHDAAAPGDAGGALEELRREERTRVLLRGFLLGAASRLDDLALAATRANAADTAAERARLGTELAELKTAIEAEEELGALLERES